MDVGDGFRTGTWIIVLYNHDCSHCRAMLPKIKAGPVLILDWHRDNWNAIAVKGDKLGSYIPGNRNLFPTLTTSISVPGQRSCTDCSANVSTATGRGRAE